MIQAPEIDPSEIEELEIIGEGSFGKVYIGRCRGKDVAIKKLNKPITDTKTLKTFKDEVGVMSSFFHPNICLFMGACTKPGNFFIVQEYLVGGDVEKILRSNAKLSLHTRLQWAKDAALGVNWLHQNNPVFIHRDLKTSNLLIDENGRVKVCDFGLSQVKRHGQMLQDRDSAKGTPLWMAPEVMNFLQFNEKADVYSFGIVLWELLTRDEPFKHHNNFEKFKRAVCIQRERPSIPESCPDSLRTLIEECWAHNANIRPSFEDIIARLNEAVVDVSINDPVGRQFWKDNFIDLSEVEWTDFAWKIFQKVGVPDDDTLTPEQRTQSIQNARCLKAMLVTQTKSKTENKEVVDIEKFGEFLEWWGPLGDPETTPWNENVLDHVRQTLQNVWFHGDIPQKRCEALLMTQPAGTFLIRYSSTVGWFCLSQISKDGKIKHQRIKHSPGTGYVFNDTDYPSIHELVASNGLEQPCPGSFYQSLFQEDPEGVYEQYD